MAYAAVRSKAVVLLLLTFCLLLLPLWESVIVLCFVVCYFMSVVVLSWWGRKSWLLCWICLPAVSWWLSGSSSRCHGVVCGLWLWYLLIILTYYFRINDIRVYMISTKYLELAKECLVMCYTCNKAVSLMSVLAVQCDRWCGAFMVHMFVFKCK